MSPESTDLSSQVTVCATESGFVQVTVVPVTTTISCGVKAKFWATTVLVPATGAGASAGAGAGAGAAAAGAGGGAAGIAAGASPPGAPVPVRVTAQILPLPVLPG